MSDDLTGQQFYLLTVLKDSGQRDRGHILWETQCKCGAVSLRRGSDLKRGKAKSCGCENRALFIDRFAFTYEDVISYKAAHKRIERARGSASNYVCIDSCGKDAEEWSYKYSDPEAIYSTAKGHYSTDPNHYEPRCVPCHRAFDRNNTQPITNRYGKY